MAKALMIEMESFPTVIPSAMTVELNSIVPTGAFTPSNSARV